MSDGSTKPSEARLYALLTLMVFFWALNYIAGKFALSELPPLMVSAIRTSMSSLMIAPIYLMYRSRTGAKAEPALKRDAPLLVGLGVLGVVGNQIFFVAGLSMTSVGHASVITALVPISVMIIAALAGKERLNARKLLGMAVALSGVALLQIGRGTQHGPSLTGDLLIFCSGISFAAFTVFGKDLSTRHGSITLNTFAYVSGAIALIPLTIWEASQHPLSAISLRAWLSVAFMALFPAVLAYLIYSYALKHLPATRVSAFSYLQPLMAISLAALVLREMPGTGFVTGGALVLGGVFVTERG